MSTWLDQKPADVVEAAIETLSRQDDPAAEALFSYCGQDMRFALWLSLANKRVRRLTGVGVFDLEDWRWRDTYDAGESPKEAVAEFLDEGGWWGDDE